MANPKVTIRSTSPTNNPSLLPDQVPLTTATRSKYRFGRTLGAGTYGIVREADSPSGKVAVKIILKKNVKGNERMVYDELDMLQRLKHPNIVRFVDWFESRVSGACGLTTAIRSGVPKANELDRTNTTSSLSWRLVASCSTGSVSRASSRRRTPPRLSGRFSGLSTTFTARMSSTEVRSLIRRCMTTLFA